MFDAWYWLSCLLFVILSLYFVVKFWFVVRSIKTFVCNINVIIQYNFNFIQFLDDLVFFDLYIFWLIREFCWANMSNDCMKVCRLPDARWSNYIEHIGHVRANCARRRLISSFQHFLTAFALCLVAQASCIIWGPRASSLNNASHEASTNRAFVHASSTMCTTQAWLQAPRVFADAKGRKLENALNNWIRFRASFPSHVNQCRESCAVAKQLACQVQAST